MDVQSRTTANIGKFLFQRLAALLSLFIALFVASGILLAIANDQQKHYSYIIGSASLQQTLQQQYAREVSVVIAAHATGDWETLFQHADSARQTEKMVDETFKGFSEGGSINISLDGKRTFQVESSQDQALKALLEKAKKEWDELKHIAVVTLRADVSSIINNPRYEELSKQVYTSTQACDEFTVAVEKKAVQAAERLIFYQILTILFGIVLFFGILAYIRQKLIAPLNRTTNALELMKIVSSISNEPGTLELRLEKSLQSICELSDWSAVTLHYWDGRQRLLYPSTITSAQSMNYLSSLSNWSGKVFNHSEGLLGHVAETLEPALCCDFSDYSMPECGELTCAFVFPILIDSGLAAVVELFAKGCQQVDDSDYSIFTHIASQLGYAFQREHTELQLRLKDRALDAASSGIAITDPKQDGNPIIYCNPIFEAVTGYTLQTQESSYSVLANPDNDQKILETLKVAFEQGKHYTAVLRNIRKNGQPFWNELTISPVNDASGELINFICIQNDITERKNLELQLFHAQKLESIGQLAAGVAHEINNPIGFIMSNQNTFKEYITIIKRLLSFYDEIFPKLAKLGTDGSDDILKKIETLKKEEDFPFLLNDIDALMGESEEGLLRVRDIVKGLKTFAHSDSVSNAEVDVNNVIDSSIKMAWNELKYKCEVVQNLATIPCVFGNAGQLSQVFVNLLVNAAQAIPEKGVITIDTYAKQDTVYIKVSDTGAGISKENLTKIMDPFFTTKPIGQGTGLGLSISFDIIKQHNGILTVESDVSRGTTFTIALPVTGKDTQAA